MKKSLTALQKCAQWLNFCLQIGWPKWTLDYMDWLWWQHHDWQTGSLTAHKAAK